ncbi:MAG: HEAT repeat domain-containing protein [Ignavibacteria bacterium]|nr:HEAT repeat domain-containing protein [Ignavibacteria bacterium]
MASLTDRTARQNNKMELWNYIQILGQKKQGWLFQKDNVEERLIALTKILEFGYPSSIQSLIPFLKDDNKAIQQTTCKVVTQLFKKIETKKGYYDTLKYCDISKSDIDFYSQTFSNEDCLTLYSIATLNNNGYVREKAIEKLAKSKNEKAIPFIVYRLADWVQAVRQTALKSIENFKKTEFINALVDNLTIFEWLQKVERTDLSSVHSDIMNFVVVENKNYVIENFKTFTDRTRILIAKQISNSEDIKLEDLKILLSDKHFLVRNFALSHFDKLTQPEIDNLLKDKSARIRMQTLYSLKNKENFSDLIFPFLSDNSASIRDFARYELKNNISDYPKIYNDNLLSNKNIIGSLSGLAETNGKDFVETVVTFLNDPKIKIRKTAFLALRHLDNGKAYNFALRNLDSEYIGIRNIIIEYFANTATKEVLQKARETYANGQFELKKSMLKLFSKVGKWTTIADIMIGTIDENENIRQLSLGYLQQWRNKATSYFTQPKEGELERANQMFKFAFEVHEEKKYFNQNPLTGIDFYLR